MLWLLLSCTGEDDWNIPVGPGEKDTEETQITEPSNDQFEEGDPIELLGYYPTWDNSMDHEHFYEWLDAAIIDEDVAVLAGLTGLALVSRHNGEIIELEQGQRTYRIDSDGRHVVAGSRTGQLL